MNTSYKRIISPEEWMSEIKRRIVSKDIKVAMLLFIFGICVYIPIITQRLPCNDGTICGIFYRQHKDYDVEDVAGRYLLKYFAHLKSMFVFSWLAVIVSIACMAISAVLICKLFKITNSLKMLIVGLFVQLSPCFVETFTYYFVTDAYVICLILVTSAVYLLHEKKTVFRAIIATGLMFLSMTFYQAYIFVAVVLFLFVLMRDLFDENKQWKEIGKGLLYQMGSGVAAFLMYVLANKVFKMVGLIYYQESRFNFSDVFNLQVLPKAIGNAYVAFYKYFFTMDYLNNTWKARNVVNAFFLVMAIVFIPILIWKKNRKWTYNLAVIGVVMILPMAFMGISILNWQEGAPRIMMLPTTCLFYIGVWMLWEGVSKECNLSIVNICGWGMHILTAYLLVILTVYIGIYQVCMQYYADKTDSMAQRIVTKIEQEYPETVAGSPVFICGGVDEGNYPQDYWITQASYIMIGTHACSGMFFNNIQGYYAGWNEYIAVNFGVEYGMVGNEAQNICDSEFFKEMPVFPAEGSIKKNEDGVVVVKLRY